MSKSISITTVGLNKVLSSLQHFPVKLKQEVNNEFSDAADQVERMAIANAPADEGGIRLSINKRRVADTYEVGVGKFYAPFVEFGTKKNFRPTRGFEDYARQFKGGTGIGGSLDESILGWVKRKKIRFEKAGQQSVIGAKKRRAAPSLKSRFLTPEQTAFIIARFISFHGVKAHPYLFPAFVKVREGLTGRIINAIKRSFK